MEKGIEQELKSFVSVRISRLEERQAFLKRLALEIDKLNDREFDKLSTGAIEWANTAISAIACNKQIPEIPAPKALIPLCFECGLFASRTVCITEEGSVKRRFIGLCHNHMPEVFDNEHLRIVQEVGKDLNYLGTNI